MHNDLPRTQIRPLDNIIVNLDRRINGGGTHWVAIINSPKLDYCLYYDPFGVAPSDIIKKFANKSGKPGKYQNSQIQNFKSSACGYFCLYVLDKFNKGNNLYDIFYGFDQKPEVMNEKIIRKYASEMV